MIKYIMPALLVLFLAGSILAQTSAPTTNPTTKPVTAPTTGAATAPAATHAGSVKLEDVLGKLPAELKPKVGEAAEQKAARDAWFKNEIGDKYLRITMEVAGIYLDIEPRSLNGLIAPNTNVEAQIEKGLKVDPLNMGDSITLEGVQPKITLAASGHVVVLVRSSRVISITPKK